MSAGITRVNGSAQAGTFHGGYQLEWYKIEHATANFGVGYTTATNTSLVGSDYEKAVRAIENVATVVVLGAPTAAGFVVGIDDASYFGRGDATGFVDNSVATLKAQIEAAVPTTATVTKLTLNGVGLA